MDNKKVDLEKIAQALIDSADREDAHLQKIADLESEVAALKEKESKITFEENNEIGDDLNKNASASDAYSEQMGAMYDDASSDYKEDSKTRLISFFSEY